MKKKNSYIIVSVAAMILFFLAVPFSLTAMGTRENAPEPVIVEAFGDIAEDLQSGEITKDEALDRLQTIHDENGNGDVERLREMEQLLTAIEAKEMTATQAKEQLQTQTQLKDQQQLQEEVKSSTQTMTQTKTGSEDAAQTQSGTVSSGNGSSGGSSGGSSIKSKGKN